MRLIDMLVAGLVFTAYLAVGAFGMVTVSEAIYEFSGQVVQEVDIAVGCCRSGMKAFCHQHEIAILYRKYFIEIIIDPIVAMGGKTIIGVGAEIVGLLQIGRVLVTIVAVRRPARPTTAGNENFIQDQPLRRQRMR